MERKIGEIFEYNGEWYQCVEQPEKDDKTVCNLCDFHGIGNCELDRCSGTYRSDKKNVVFKKLEKVGETITVIGRTFQKFTNSNSCVGCVFCNENNGCDKCCYMDEPCLDNEIWIEVKQPKEDIEEYKMYDAKEDIPEFDKVVDECLFGKQELNKEDMEETKLNIKPFSLEAAKAGKPVCTRDGRKARIICCDFKRPNPIIALVENGNAEDILVYPLSGEYHNRVLPENDLFMLPEKKEGWLNGYKERCYETKEEAISCRACNMECIDTIKVKWEE